MFKGLLYALIWFWFIARVYLHILKLPYRPAVVVSPKIMDAISTMHGFEPWKAKAASFFPFVILRFQDHEMNATRIRHETIHHYQQMESLWMSFILDIVEQAYAKVFLHKSPLQAYFYSAVEQEAYLNQTDENYLKNRNAFRILHHIFFKKEFHLENYKVVLD